MAKIIKTESPAGGTGKSVVLAAISDRIAYINSRREIEGISGEHGLKVVDIPAAISMITAHPCVREAIIPDWIDTITGEYHGRRNGDRYYEVWHSAGSLSTAKGLAGSFPRSAENAFMSITEAEWSSAQKGFSNGRIVVRVHLNDIRKDDVPEPSVPYTVYVNLDKDELNIGRSGQLSYDSFMRDDRVLMLAGSSKNRELLAGLFFRKKEDGGLGCGSVGSYHRIRVIPFEERAKGRLTYLYMNDKGLGGVSRIINDGLFLAARF